MYFVKKTKYKPETRTREHLRSARELRADKKAKESALLHIKCHTKMSCIATEISGICAKDLILSSEAKYTTCTVKTRVLIYTPKVCFKTHHGV